MSDNKAMIKRIGFVKMCSDKNIISMFMVISMLEGISSGYNVSYNEVRDLFNNIEDFVDFDQSWLEWHSELK